MRWNDELDIHVHCRDEEQWRKATIASVLRLAAICGVRVIFDMPNTFRPVTDRLRVAERLLLVPKGEEARYRLWVGLTGDPDQIREAVYCYLKFGQVIGFKMFVGKSVGDLSVIDEAKQRLVYEILTDFRFDGVLALHCEKESLLHPGLWNYQHPISHCLARPPEAEIWSVRDQIRIASEVGFTGGLHICHVSCPPSVKAVNEARQAGMRITCGVTPHHIRWDSSMMLGPYGTRVKMNPPLRSKADVAGLREQLRGGLIDVLESDHAPHELAEQDGAPFMSGYPSLNLWPDTVDRLLRDEVGLTEPQIRALVHDNAVTMFADKF